MKFSTADELMFDEFFKLKESNKFSEALLVIRKIEKNHKNSSVVLGLLGTIYYELKDYKNSSKYFKRTVLLNPKSELASLGLFHSFKHLGENIPAMKEIHRYVSLAKPKLYKTAIKELSDNIHNVRSPFEKKIIIEISKKVSHNKS